MKYIDSVTDFFKSPKWVNNLLFGGLCILPFFILSAAGYRLMYGFVYPNFCNIILAAGFVPLLGWHITGFWMRSDQRPETFPNFDFQQLSKYFERGLWPVLVIWACNWALRLIMWFPLLLIAKVFGGIAAFLASIVLSGVSMVMAVALMFILIPLVIRAILAQDFVKAFDLPFVKRFISLMWMEMLLSALFMIAAGIALTLAGLVAVCVGIPFGMSVAVYASSHLYRQLYDVYLSRGGEPITPSPKLAEAPVTVLPPA